ncbi:hypothetical protein PCANC_10607 [Puccinia coronata f. sp. avenae]|uniref:Uncharacterized protein n=1 Tax=Puccinia coronata f. sp. avenae TaxID=200324 RepID=A0A2N5VR95_9BASI|nr:hypothetical protein PCANC_10607 [Puccinia coronata f. sp. avenae]
MILGVPRGTPVGRRHQLSHPLKSQKHVTSSELLLDSRGHKESPRNPARPHWWSGTWPHSNHSAAALAADATPTGQEAFTVNPGPPMLFEASSRQAWLHLLVLPAPYILLGVPRGRLAKPRRVLSVHSLAPDSDTILLTSSPRLTPLPLRTRSHAPVTPSPCPPRWTSIIGEPRSPRPTGNLLSSCMPHPLASRPCLSRESVSSSSKLLSSNSPMGAWSVGSASLSVVPTLPLF